MIPSIGFDDLRRDSAYSVPLDFAKDNNQANIDSNKESADNSFGLSERAIEKIQSVAQQAQVGNYLKDAQLESQRSGSNNTNTAIAALLSQPATFRYWS
ncbi:MAG: hypothetical protein KME54_28885 [Tolypothrix brevis GSE-NOS-MK-07-07A]|nr:hypothetical protein [Tolypothrix brevis GSE-NOS-MK-07-07A]